MFLVSGADQFQDPRAEPAASCGRATQAALRPERKHSLHELDGQTKPKFFAHGPNPKHPPVQKRLQPGASWVDTYYAFGTSVQNSIAIAELFEKVLWRDWALDIKPLIPSLLSPMVLLDQ